jgi:predicted Fe-S protein YdhL (DUF1289 family)
MMNDHPVGFQTQLAIGLTKRRHSVSLCRRDRAWGNVRVDNSQPSKDKDKLRADPAPLCRRAKCDDSGHSSEHGLVDGEQDFGNPSGTGAWLIENIDESKVCNGYINKSVEICAWLRMNSRSKFPMNFDPCPNASEYDQNHHVNWAAAKIPRPQKSIDRAFLRRSRPL